MRRGRARRRDLVLPRRPRPRPPCRAHTQAAGGREPERGHVRALRPSRHPGAHRADERRSGADRRRDGRRPARLPALFRARALPARGAGFRHEGARAGAALRAVLDALAAPGLGAVVVCPSNPYISIDPIFAVPGVRDALRDCRAPAIAVSPIVGGRAVKGPTAKMMEERGIAPGAAAIAAHTPADRRPRARRGGPGRGARHRRHRRRVEVTATLMTTRADKQALAQAVLALAERIGPQSSSTA